jgi:hypothetical protein
MQRLNPDQQQKYLKAGLHMVEMPVAHDILL